MYDVRMDIFSLRCLTTESHFFLNPIDNQKVIMEFRNWEHIATLGVRMGFWMSFFREQDVNGLWIVDLLIPPLCDFHTFFETTIGITSKDFIDIFWFDRWVLPVDED